MFPLQLCVLFETAWFVKQLRLDHPHRQSAERRTPNTAVYCTDNDDNNPHSWFTHSSLHIRSYAAPERKIEQEKRVNISRNDSHISLHIRGGFTSAKAMHSGLDETVIVTWFMCFLPVHLLVGLNCFVLFCLFFLLGSHCLRCVRALLRSFARSQTWGKVWNSKSHFQIRKNRNA